MVSPSMYLPMYPSMYPSMYFSLYLARHFDYMGCMMGTPYIIVLLLFLLLGDIFPCVVARLSHSLGVRLCVLRSLALYCFGKSIKWHFGGDIVASHIPLAVGGDAVLLIEVLAHTLPPLACEVCEYNGG